MAAVDGEDQQEPLYQRLADRILGVARPHPVRVAIDGIDNAGKTTLADRLAGVLRLSGRQIMRGSIDSFHHPRAIRYRQGRSSAEGYFLDSFNLEAVRRELLQPLGPEGDGRYRGEFFDVRRDCAVVTPQRQASRDAILLFDGVFLCQDDLRNFWDLVIYLRVSFETGLARGTRRDRQLGGNEAATRRLYQERYYPGQRIYHQTCDPESRADLVVDTEVFERPYMVREG